MIAPDQQLIRENTILHGLAAGVRISRGSNVIVEKNTIEERKIEEILGNRIPADRIPKGGMFGALKLFTNEFFAGYCGAIHVSDESIAQIVENTICGHVRGSVGILIVAPTTVVIEKNIIRDKSHGIHAKGGKAKIYSNTFENNYESIYLTDGYDGETCHNAITGKGDGIIASHSGAARIYGNGINISGSHGIKVNYCSPLIENNSISSRASGIIVKGGLSKPQIISNRSSVSVAEYGGAVVQNNVGNMNIADGCKGNVIIK